MKHLVAVLIVGLYLSGGSPVVLALELGAGKGNVKDAQATLNEMTKEADDKVREAKGEAKEESMAEKIQSKSKDDIQEKIDDMKSDVMGK
ncbi:MAG: hypothetical protein NPIRA02_41410 [Nitrospirales bacterium]|nr:MAG: hypothetical protein NPIRA02_41410 [Nitrospirales bacterium]